MTPPFIIILFVMVFALIFTLADNATKKILKTFEQRIECLEMIIDDRD